MMVFDILDIMRHKLLIFDIRKDKISKFDIFEVYIAYFDIHKEFSSNANTESDSRFLSG